MSCSTFKTLNISFVAPSIAPANGYIIRWRIVGDTTWNAPANQYGNPIQVANIPSCYNIEGFIQADCGNGNTGNPVNFAITSSSSACWQFTLQSTANYTYTPCGSNIPQTITNTSGSPQTICAIDGTVSGGSYSRTVSCNV